MNCILMCSRHCFKSMRSCTVSNVNGRLCIVRIMRIVGKSTKKKSEMHAYGVGKYWGIVSIG